MAVRLATVGLAAALVVASAGCESTAAPAPTQPTAITLTGTWTGNASDSSGPGRITWQVTQSGSSFAGSLSTIDSGTNVAGRGTVSGELTGSSIHFSMRVAAGGFDPPYESCSVEASGDAQLSASSIAGGYSGVNSCTGVVAAGQMTLARTP